MSLKDQRREALKWQGERFLQQLSMQSIIAWMNRNTTDLHARLEKKRPATTVGASLYGDKFERVED